MSNQEERIELAKSREYLVRAGWGFCPRTLNDVADFLDELADAADAAWAVGMDLGMFPREDVPPSEGMRRAEEMIRGIGR